MGGAGPPGVRLPASIVLGVGEHEVPAVEAVGTAVGDDVTRLPGVVRWGVRDQVRDAAAVDADDGLGHVHPFSMAPPDRVGGRVPPREGLAADRSGREGAGLPD